MTNNLDDETEPIKDLKIVLQSVKDELLEKLKIVVAVETEEIKNSQKQIAEKLQSIEDAVSKMSILSNNSSNAAPESNRFILKHEFKNLNKMEDFDGDYSGDVVCCNATWWIGLERMDDRFTFYISFETEQRNMSIEAKLTFKLIGYNNVTKIMKRCFRWRENTYDTLELEDIEDGGQVPDNLTLEVEVEILKITGFKKEKMRAFDESQKDVSDVVLVVQDTRFYVSKMVHIHLFHL
ncbi:hypothetical protein B9Z55_002821 [Caenorhabditis nigoni]|uniref:MATH domain-containing protein n=1 Tax=Caenorhabditis nigoni TaxID=1611254 RepID=A0A2G5VMK6_9PELO|nr:hypothetical protein B9Z55_002821 [Caenorhabditis nigoni]